MPALTDQAIVLRTWDFSETSQTVSLLTRDHGIVRALAKGSRRPRSAFDGGLEILTRGHIAAIIKPTAELATLTEWGSPSIFPHLRTSLTAHRAAFLIVDLVHHLFQPNDPHPRLFDAVLDALRALAHDAPSGPTIASFRRPRRGRVRPRSTATPSPMTLAPAESFAFSASAGGLIPDPGPASQPDGIWALRGDTPSCLLDISAGAPLDASPPTHRRRTTPHRLRRMDYRTLTASAASWSQVAGESNDSGGT
ncbi:MAG: DNA repair protein RecO [Phycisphaerales bacterium]